MFPSSQVAGLSFVTVIIGQPALSMKISTQILFYSTIPVQTKKKRRNDINMKVLFLNYFQKELFSFMIWA